MKTRWMFERISPYYDLLNHLLSAGQDILWRRKAVKCLLSAGGEVFLDVATGTGDVALEILRQKPASEVVGLDPAKGMLLVAKRKAQKKGVDLKLVRGEGERLPFPDKSFNGVTIAFGIRNVENRKEALREFYRVLKEEGTLAILEFYRPEGLLGKLYSLYFKYLLPLIGWIISKDREAYSYLPESVEKFPSPPEFARELTDAGFKYVIMEPLTFGICYLYMATKS